MPQIRSPLRKRLFSLTTPIFVETLLIMMLGVVDTIMLGLYADKAVAAVGVVNQLLFLVFLAFGVTTAGTTVLCSQYLGARQKEGFLQSVGVSLVFNTLLGAGVSFLLWHHCEVLLRLMDLQPELMDDAVAYMRLVGGGAALQAVALTLSAVLRSAGLAVWPMWATLIMNILNIFGNSVLIFGALGMPEMGVTGAALSTVCSRGVCMVMLLFVTFRTAVPSLPLRLFRPLPLDKLVNLLRIGLPSAGEQISYCFSQVVITYFINMLGTDALTARTYSVNLVMVSFLFSLALGQGGSICIGHLVGEGRKRAAYVLGMYCLRVSVTVTIIMSLVTALGGRWVIGLLTDNAQAAAMVCAVLLVDVLLEGGRAVNILFVNALRSTGDAAYPFWVGVVVMWIVATGLGYVFGIAMGFGLTGMWVAFAMDENLRAVILLRRWKSRRWESKSLIRRNGQNGTGSA